MKKVWQAERQTVFLQKENPFDNVICKILAIISGLNIGLVDAYFFIKVYNQPKLKRETLHISKFQNKTLYQ